MRKLNHWQPAKTANAAKLRKQRPGKKNAVAKYEFEFHRIEAIILSGGFSSG